jgi:hypothetical protein
MPEMTWDPEVCWERAAEWWLKAVDLPENGPGRLTCEVIAEGYARLAELIDAQRGVRVSGDGKLSV